MRRKVIKLTQTSQGCPDQWEGHLEGGAYLYARERHGWIRVDVDSITVYEGRGDDPYEVLLANVRFERAAVRRKGNKCELRLKKRSSASFRTN